MRFHLRACIRAVCSLGILLAHSSWALAQARGQQLSLADALDIARRTSPDVRAAREAVAAAEGRERQARAFPNPTFAYGREQTSAPGVRNSQNVAALEQRLELGGIRSARQDVAHLRSEAAAARLVVAQSQVVFETTRAYAAALAADRRAGLATQVAEAFSRALGISEQRLASGDVSGYAHRRVRLEAARYAVLKAEAVLARRAARVALGALLSGSADSLAFLEISLSDTLPPTAQSVRTAVRGDASVIPDTLLRVAVQARADLRAARLEADVARAEARLATSERVPLPVISLGFKDEALASSDARATGFVAGISLALPLWDRRDGAVAAAQADIRRRDADVDALRRRVLRDAADAYDAYAALAAQLEALTPLLGLETDNALRAVQVAYTEGEATLVEYLDAVRTYHDAETGLATLRAEVLVRRAALERALGSDLTSVPVPPAGAAAPASNR